MSISIAQAFAQWQELSADIPKNDSAALAVSWNDYTDSLAKDGELTALQYHYCPAYDDDMPGEGTRFDALAGDREFILEAMGVDLDQVQLPSRTDGTQWDKGASHWRVTITRTGRASFNVEYSMGSAHKGLPDLCDVMNSLLLDSSNVDESFEDWCANYGYDTDSRKAEAAYEACKETARQLGEMFTASELEGLRELFEGM